MHPVPLGCPVIVPGWGSLTTFSLTIFIGIVGLPPYVSLHSHTIQVHIDTTLPTKVNLYVHTPNLNSALLIDNASNNSDSTLWGVNTFKEVDLNLKGKRARISRM
ncbi:unnamed protein product [Pieris brassicae]|uniref:Uncharacterized protein n=1 Tax=Pieris brassicae TaxID=7116 RepID=A0A9P0TFA2_PIEBR|nr:unnamed protein product [Pieris brassicae]